MQRSVPLGRIRRRLGDAARTGPRPIPIRAAPPRAGPLAKPGCSCGGGCPSCQGQAISGPAHPAEREADAVAAQVMAMADPAPVRGMEDAALMRQPEEAEEALQTQAEEEEKDDEEALQTQPEDEEEEGTPVQARAEAGAAGAAAPAGNPLSGLGGGRRLPAALRRFFEPRFGRSFAGVRIHDGPAAQARARGVRAQAFTYGRDIVFGPGRYSPDTAAGRHLLAHELTHVVQQGRAGAAVQRWAVTGNTAVADDPGDVLWNLARDHGTSGNDWTCIVPLSMRTARMSPPPADFNERYERYVQIGDRFDISNLRLRRGPGLDLHLFTSPRDVAIAGLFYPGMTASSGDVDNDIQVAAGDGATPIRSMTLFGHAGGASIWGGTGTFAPGTLTPEPATFNLANARLLPRRCWFTRNARVRAVGCSSTAFAEAFAQVYLRRGAAIRSTTSAVSPCCFGVWTRLAFTATAAAGSAILDGPFATTRAFHRSRFWARIRGRL